MYKTYSNSVIYGSDAPEEPKKDDFRVTEEQWKTMVFRQDRLESENEINRAKIVTLENTVRCLTLELHKTKEENERLAKSNKKYSEDLEQSLMNAEDLNKTINALMLENEKLKASKEINKEEMKEEMLKRQADEIDRMYKYTEKLRSTIERLRCGQVEFGSEDA